MSLGTYCCSLAFAWLRRVFFFFNCLLTFSRVTTSQHIVILGATTVGVWFNSLELSGNVLPFCFTAWGATHFLILLDTHACVDSCLCWGVVMEGMVWSHAFGLVRVGKYGMKIVVNAPLTEVRYT